MKKRLIVVLLFILIVLSATFGFILIFNNKKDENIENELHNNINQENEIEEFVQKQENGIKLNISTELNKVKRLDNMEISNIQLINQGDQSILTADVKNVGNSTINLTVISIKILNKDKKVVGILEGLIDHIEPNETTQLNVGTQDDIANAYDFEITKK